jgi:hypothetical protein
MGCGRREVQQLTIQLSQGMNLLFMDGGWNACHTRVGGWNACHTRVDWNCFTPHQWDMLVIFRIAWLYIEVMFVVGHQRK